MTTNFSYPTAAELFAPSASAPIPTPNTPSNKVGIIISLIVIIGGCAAIAIYQYQMRQQLIRNINAGLKTNK